MAKKNSGHTMGQMPGNMMGHSSSTTPFQNTGHHPKGGNLTEVSLDALKSSNARNPGAKAHEAGSLAKLDASK